MSASDAGVDVVYTWVDGAWPGYPELLAEYSEKPQDLNPNRYRDNLDVLKYSMRSLYRFAPWVRHVYLVTTSPQVPEWLDPDATGVSVVHHEAIFDPEDLPTFNSFAIVSNLHRVPGVSRRFLYMEDDRLFASPTTLSDFIWDDGVLKLHEKWERTNAASTYERASNSPWESALAYSNHLLDARYGVSRRRSVKHAPLLIDCDSFERFVVAFEAAVRTTRASRFRSVYNVAPEHMYPFYLLHEGLARRVSRSEAYRSGSYIGLGNFAWMDRVGLWHLKLRKPRFFAMNDNFEHAPNPRAVELVQRWLEAQYPDPSPLERSCSARDTKR